MKRLFRSFAFLFVFAISTANVFAQTAVADKPAAPAKPVETFAQFQARLQKAAAHSRFSAAMLGIKVESLDTGKVIFEQHADKLLKPASNAKMYTGALALDRFGPDHKIRTSFYAASRPDAAGRLAGDLIVFGRGDPSLSHRFNDGDYDVAINKIADAIIKAGIKRIEGDLVGDESYFRGSRFGVNWAVDDLQYYYGAEVSALTLQENAVDLVIRPGENIGDPLKISTKPETTYLKFENRSRTVEKEGRRGVSLYRPIDSNVVYVQGSLPLDGSADEDAVAVQNAPLWFVTTLRDALEKRGVTVGGKLQTVNALDRDVNPLDLSKLTEVAFIESKPMAEIVKNMMKPSQNLYAHMLLLLVGEKIRGSEDRRSDSDNLGIEEMKKFLAEAGIKSGDVLLEEGSGLSRGCLLKPAASVDLLKYMNKHRYAQAFYDSLPIAGVDGTLRARFKGTAAEKNIHAKTGTIRYVNSISGYVTTAANEKLVFSIMLNAYNGTDGRTHTDGIAAMLAELSQHSGQ